MQYLIAVFLTLGFIGLASTAFADRFQNFNKSMSNSIHYKSPENKALDYKGSEVHKRSGGRKPASFGAIDAIPKKKEVKDRQDDPQSPLPLKW